MKPIINKTDLNSPNNVFPNGFSDYQETYCEVCLEIGKLLSDEHSKDVANKRYEEQGRGGIYELAEELTNKFEKKYDGVEWGEDADYYDTLDEFLTKELYSNEL